MSRKNILLSIIIPVFNVEQYLRECLDSIISQMDGDIEVILVDDGSTDSSGDICEEYSSENITVIHRSNKGSGKARNLGYYHSRGKYIWYIDSDDYILDHSIEWIRENLKDDLDILLFSANSFSDGAAVLANYDRKYSLNEVITGKALLKNTFRRSDYFTPVWMRIYRRDFLADTGVLFGAEKLYEDEQYAFLTLYFAERVMAANKQLYMRRYRPGSKMVEARACTVVNFIDKCNGYGNAALRLLKVYDKEQGRDRGLLLWPLDNYLGSIVNSYYMLDAKTSLRYAYIVRKLGKRLDPYENALPTRFRNPFKYPFVCFMYKKVKRRLATVRILKKIKSVCSHAKSLLRDNNA